MRSPIALLPLLLLAACSPDRETGPNEHPAPAPGMALECRADAVVETFVCALPTGPEGAPGLGTFGDQGINIALQSKQVSYTPANKTFSASVTIENLMGGPLGTPDGSTTSGIDVFFLNEPSASPGGTVTVKNPTGHQDFTGTEQPYFHYNVKLGPGAKSGALQWQFQFAGTATSFTFWVLVSAETPAQGAIQNWVLVPGFGSPNVLGVYGFGADGQVVYGDSGEISYRVNGDWRSIYDTLASPVVSSRYTFAWSTREIWSYVDVGGIRKPRKWDGGNWRPMDELPIYPGQDAVGIGTTGPGRTWAFGEGLWRLQGDTLWIADTLPTPSSGFTAMTAIGILPLLVDVEGKNWLWHGGNYTQVGASSSGLNSAIAVFGVDTSHFWVLNDVPAQADLRLYSGGGWSTPTIPVTATKNAGFIPVTGVALSPTDAYVIANNGPHGVVLHWDGATWAVDHEDLTVAYTGIWARNANEIDLSLANGTIEVRRNGLWSSTDPLAAKPDPNTFPAAWLSAEGEGYLINELGMIYHYTGGEPVVVDTSTITPAPGARLSLWSSGVNDVWVAFGGSQLWHYTGPGIGTVPVPGFNIRAVGGSASNDVWGVANEGQIVHYDGFSWDEELGVADCPDCEDWNAVWAYGPNFAVAVGDNGQIGIWDGDEWTVTTHGSDNLLSISGSSPTDAWVGGEGGTMWQLSGTSWTSYVLPGNKDVVGIWIASPQEGYAVMGAKSFRWNGLAWSAMEIPEMKNVSNRGITGFGDDAFIVGSRLFRGWR